MNILITSIVDLKKIPAQQAPSAGEAFVEEAERMVGWGRE
jgi:hypothetical protein